MKRIDHVRKTVYLIVGCLTIFSLVLTICHKVGHCASSDNSVNGFYPLDYPLPINGELFGSSFSIDSHVIEKILSVSQNSSNDCIIIHEESVANNYIQVEVYEYGSFGFQAHLPSDDPTIFNTSYNWRVVKSSFIQYNFDTDTASFISIAQDNGGLEGFYLLPYQFFASLPNGNYYLPFNTFINHYPLWVNSGSLVYNGFTYFENYDDSPIFSGHSKGGVLANYIDSDDLIEQDSSLPTVDTTSPADPSSNSGWFQKILNGLSKINQSIKGGVLTIGDYIGQGFENIINWLTEPFDQEQFSSDLNHISLINDLSSLKTLVENCGMFDWSDVTPAQSVSFTFDFGGAVLPHTSCVIDFSWYTGTVKNICVAVICTFLVLGLLVTIINQLPNIIGGKSGDKGGGSDS